jgi:hypothetical protein
MFLSGARRVPLPVALDAEATKPMLRLTAHGKSLTVAAGRSVATNHPGGEGMVHQPEASDKLRTGDVTKPIPRLTRKPSAPALASKPRSKMDTRLTRKPSAPVLTSRERSKPLPALTKKPSTIDVTSSGQVMGLSEPKTAPSIVLRGSDKTSGVHKPTMSQIARAQAAETERRAAESRIAIEKPLWGRAAPRKVVPTTRPLSIIAKVPVTKKPSTNHVDGNDSKKVEDSILRPAHVPLPPSPLLEARDQHDSEGRVCPGSPEGSDGVYGSTCLNGGELRSEILVGEKEDGETEIKSSPVPTLHSLGRTPISSLLTSIQRGFVFTPSSPLSPPESYLHASTTNRGPPLVFPIKQLQQVATSGNEELPAVVTLTAGSLRGKLPGEDVERQVLSDVELNQSDSSIFV